jgi:hypothetical protein
MYDIFISYSNKDIEVVKILVDCFVSKGLSVWWDKKILPGQSFDSTINENLINAKSVIVLWSKTSIKSDWVLAEASYAKNKEKIIPVLLEEVTIPLEFSRIQFSSLINWERNNSDKNFIKLLDAIINKIGHKPNPKIEDSQVNFFVINSAIELQEFSEECPVILFTTDADKRSILGWGGAPMIIRDFQKLSFPIIRKYIRKKDVNICYGILGHLLGRTNLSYYLETINYCHDGCFYIQQGKILECEKFSFFSHSDLTDSERDIQAALKYIKKYDL